MYFRLSQLKKLWITKVPRTFQRTLLAWMLKFHYNYVCQLITFAIFSSHLFIFQTYNNIHRTSTITKHDDNNHQHKIFFMMVIIIVLSILLPYTTNNVQAVPQTGPPRITFKKRQFFIGEKLIANCTTSKAQPAPHITWLINGKKVNFTFYIYL